MLNTSGTSTQITKITLFPQFYGLSKIHPLFCAPPSKFCFPGCETCSHEGRIGDTRDLHPPSCYQLSPELQAQRLLRQLLLPRCQLCSMRSPPERQTKPSLLFRGSSEDVLNGPVEDDTLGIAAPASNCHVPWELH